MLRTKDFFTLLPRRHVPIEPHHPVSYVATPTLRMPLSKDTWRVYCSGVAQNEATAVAVIIVPPHAPKGRWLVRRYQLPARSSETEAELTAMLEASTMCKSLIRSNTAALLQLVTDSLLAVQVLFGAVRSASHSILHARLQSNWHLIGHVVHVSCVGHPCRDAIYEQAVLQEKTAWSCNIPKGILRAACPAFVLLSSFRSWVN